MEDGISTLAFGHRSINATIESTRANATDVGRTFTAQNARMLNIPLCKRKQMPAGQDPGDCARDARRVFTACAQPDTDDDHYTGLLPAPPAPPPRACHSVVCPPAAHPTSYYGSNKSAPSRVAPTLDELFTFMIDEDSS